MSDRELKTHIVTMSEKRTLLQAKIGELAKKRQAYIEKKLKAEKDAGKSSLDAKIYHCIQTQGLKKGIHFTQGPEY